MPRAPYRQWVFTVPKALRLRLARDPAWTTWVGNLAVRAIGACSGGSPASATSAHRGPAHHGATANPASVPVDKKLGPGHASGHIVVMMELRNTQDISTSASLQWNAGHLAYRNAGTLAAALGRLYQ